MKQKILFFSHSSRLNGSQYMLLLTIKYLDRDKFSCVVICPSKGQLVDELNKLGVKTYIIPTFNWIFGDNKSLLQHFTRSLLSIALQIITIPIFLFVSVLEKPDIIYSNTTHNCTGMILSLLTKKIHVWHIHEMFTDDYYCSYLSKKTIANLISKYSTKIIAVSNTVAGQFDNNYPSDKIITIYNGLNQKYPESKPQCFPHDICTENDWVITLIGYITPLKKQDVAIKSIKELVREIPNIKLLLVGASANNDEYENKLNNLVQSFGLENHVVFTGRRTDVIDILNNSKALIIASSTEGLPIVALEAMYCSIPIIASNTSGNIEVVKDEVNGLLFNHEDSEDLSKKILLLYNNPKLLSTFGLNGKDNLHQNFSIEKYINNIEKVISSQ